MRSLYRINLNQKLPKTDNKFCFDIAYQQKDVLKPTHVCLSVVVDFYPQHGLLLRLGNLSFFTIKIEHALNQLQKKLILVLSNIYTETLTSKKFHTLKFIT